MSKHSKRNWWSRIKHHSSRAGNQNRSARSTRARLVEKLEERIVFSVEPIVAVPTTHQQIWDRMLEQAFTNAADLSNYTVDQLENAAQWVVKTDSSIDASNFVAQTGMFLAQASTSLDNTFYALANNLTSSAITNLLSNNPGVEYFYPSVNLNLTTDSLPNDPYLKDQWYLFNTGQEISHPNEVNNFTSWNYDLNIEEAWKKATGEGIVVAVTDTGVYYQHPDLVDNFDTSLGFNFNQNNQSTHIDTNADFHGTAVAGIIGAVGDNGIGTAGVAYNATLTDFRFLGTDLLGVTLDEDDYYGLFAYNNEYIDVYNNSWGEGDPSHALSPISPGMAQGVIDAVFQGRGGLGAIHIKTSGNSALSGDIAGHSQLNASPYLIVVSGYGPDGTAVPYAEGGATVMVTATTDHMLTTDLPGDLGYNTSDTGLFHDGDYFEDLDYTSEFNGTSAAAPTVSGVVALMLEAAGNNGIELSVRDVQHILARSASHIDADNGWQTNIQPLFFDPLEEMGIPVGATDPTYPGVSGVPDSTDFQFALARNSAGFTVHSGSYGHGAVDANMAVELASTWQTVGRQEDVDILHSNFSFSVAAAENVGGVTIPGGIGGVGGFDEYFDLWLNPPPPDEDLPDPLPINTRGAQSIPIEVPAQHSVEWVEVTVNMNIDPVDSELVRFTLVSPDGTHSELNQWAKTPTNGPITNDGQVSFTFSTNRHWGERTEGVGTINPITGERIEPLSVIDDNGVTTAGVWQLVVENWSGSATSVSGAIDFHASPTEAINYRGDLLGGRIQGSIGLDIDEDGVYDFVGVQAEETTVMGLAGIPEAVIVDNAAMPTGDSFVIPDAEPKVSGVKVYIDLNRNGEHDEGEQYTYTSADGNYYFDLVWNTTSPDDVDSPYYNYQVRFELPEGYTVVGDDMHEYRIGVQDDMGTVGAYHVDSNFILAPEPVTVSGNVYIDFNVNDTYDHTESTVSEFRVFADLNENGILDYLDINGNRQFDNGIDEALEPMTITGFDGSYNLVISTSDNLDTDFFGNDLVFHDLYVGAGFYTIMLDAVDDWSSTSDDLTAEGFAGTFSGTPSDALPFKRVYARPGQNFADMHFGVVPEGTATLSGHVFADQNQNGFRDGSETGISGVMVYLELDGEEGPTNGDITGFTGLNGSYLFEDLAAGTYEIHVVPPDEFTGTVPVLGAHLGVTLSAGQSKGNGSLDFGFYNPAGIPTPDLDYGDLPGNYATTASSGGPSHGIVDIYYLGAGVSAETDGQPDPSGNLDTNDDGVEFLSPIVAGTPVSLNVTASTNVLYLQGWIDFNNDGDFDDPGEHLAFDDGSGTVSKQLRLEAGLNELSFTASTEVTSDALAARFRYGEGGFAQYNKPNGAALVGEVEDYIVTANPSTAFIEPIAGDFDGSGFVDQVDYLVWKATMGSTTDLRADGNGDSKVNLADFTIWRNNLGAAAPVQVVMAPLAGTSSSTDEPSTIPSSALPAGLLTSGPDGVATFTTSTDDADSSTSAAGGNDATDTGAVDLAFVVEEEDDMSDISEYIGSDDSTAAALAVALEEEFDDLL